MKQVRNYAATIMIMAAAACNSGTTTNTTTTDSTAALNPGDSSVTTTTTTTVTHHPYSGSFVPQATVKYLDLRTNKKINVRVDTSSGSLVNSEDNQPLDEDLLVEPVKHDTIYAKTGNVVNNYVIHEDAGYRVDTVRVNTVEVHTVEAAPTQSSQTTVITNDTKGKGKTKERNGKVKEKDK